MRRPGLITVSALIQLLLGLVWVGVTIFLLFLIRSPAMRQAQGADAAIWGLKIAGGLIGPLALLALLGAYGMHKDRRWGWWVSFLIDFGVASAVVYAVIDDGWNNADPQLIIPALIFAIPVVLLLLPGVRRFYRGSSDHQLRPPAVDPPLGQST